MELDILDLKESEICTIRLIKDWLSSVFQLAESNVLSYSTNVLKRMLDAALIVICPTLTSEFLYRGPSVCQLAEWTRILRHLLSGG